MSRSATRARKLEGVRTSPIPKVIHAAAIDRFGGPDVLTLHEVPAPSLDANEVLIRIDTAGVGIWDVWMRQESEDGASDFPLVLGTDGSGTVAAVGSDAGRFKIGDRVYAYGYGNRKGGFYAEYVAVAAENVARIPQSLDLERAGAIPTTGLTALQGIDDALEIKQGETLVIHGAAGGVGSLAIQFAKLRGARVFATATGADGIALAKRLGTDQVVDGRSGDIAAAISKFAPHGVDAVLAFAGGEALDQCVAAIRKGGRLAYPNGVDPAPEQPPGVEAVVYDGVPGVEQFERLSRAVDDAKIEVVIAERYPLAKAAKAHARIEKGHVLGKIVLKT